MELTVNHTFLLVSDQDAALAFYRDVLGLQVGADVQWDGMRWLTVVSPTQPGLQIGLMSPHANYASAEDARAAIEVTAKGLIPGLIFETPDVDAAFEQLRAAGAEVEQEPIDQPYGVRDCAFRDPFGNHLRFAGPAKG
jgi:catechol 2,3-dioxygenase-like lactoylglutathione lyase family enzyme